MWIWIRWALWTRNEFLEIYLLSTCYVFYRLMAHMKDHFFHLLLHCHHTGPAGPKHKLLYHPIHQALLNPGWVLHGPLIWTRSAWHLWQLDGFCTHSVPQWLWQIHFYLLMLYKSSWCKLSIRRLVIKNTATCAMTQCWYVFGLEMFNHNPLFIEPCWWNIISETECFSTNQYQRDYSYRSWAVLLLCIKISWFTCNTV